MKVPDAFKALNITELNPVQKEAVATKFIENNANLIVASPTGSGKTLIAMLAALKVMQEKKKVLYTCPLKALATEQFETFKVFEKLGFKVALSIGDLDSSDKYLEKYDLIVTTMEKADSLMRHKAKFVPYIGLLVADEVHLIDSNRGPTLEILISRFKHLFPNVQILGLSATIPNAKELATWLDAELVESKWRPTKLVKGVLFDQMIETTDGTIELSSTKKDSVHKIVEDSLARNAELLIFCNTRKSAESTAMQLTSLVAKYSDITKLQKLAYDVENALESPTKQCKKLADCVRNGVAFHSAGLVTKQRKLIEDGFRNRLIKVIASTPTLALGVNLPAEVVVMKSMYRYYETGTATIPVREYLQCSGRAGRPGFKEQGLSVIISKTEVEKEEYFEKYVLGDAEPVHSQLGWEPVLRTQILASIAIGFTPSQEKIKEFFMHSFYAHQYGEIDTILRKVDLILEELIGMDFITYRSRKLVATELGRRVSELYIDPISAYNIIKAMKEREMEDIGLIYMITSTSELAPYFRVRAKEESDMWTEAYSKEKALGINAGTIGFEDYKFLDKFKTTKVFYEWINEKTEDLLADEYNLSPGILRAKLREANWMIYSAIELAKLAKLKENIGDLRKLERRLKYGVKAELLPLVELKGIGRVRARRLFLNSVTKISQVKSMPLDDLSRILGSGTALNIKRQLGEKISKIDERKVKTKEIPQTLLGDF